MKSFLTFVGGRRVVEDLLQGERRSGVVGEVECGVISKAKIIRVEQLGTD